MMNNQPQELDSDSFCQLPKEELVKKIIEQVIVIGELQATINELKQSYRTDSCQ